MASDQTRRQGRASSIMLHVEAIGLGLLAAGMVLFAFAYLGAYLRAGVDGLIDAVNPLLPASYLPLLALVPGLFLMWLSRKISSR